MAARKDHQANYFDRTIESSEIEAAIEVIQSYREDGTLKAIQKARKTVQTVVEAYELKDGERLRCGAYIITGRSRVGGGFSVPTWEKVTVGAITDLAE